MVQSCPNFKLLPINISCECSSFVWNNRGVNVGMCNSVDLDGRPLCYLHQPNNCRDAVDSQVIPGMQVIQVFQDFFDINRTQLFSCSVEPFETSCRSPRSGAWRLRPLTTWSLGSYRTFWGSPNTRLDLVYHIHTQVRLLYCSFS